VLIERQRETLRLIHEKLCQENFYWEVGYMALLIAGAVHFGFLLLFLYLKFYLMAAVNIVSVILYWYTIFGIGLQTLEKKDDGLIGWLVYAELMGHNVAATFYFGAEAGYHYYIYLLVLFPFFVSTYRMPVYLFRVVSSLVTAVWLDVSDGFQQGRVVSDSTVIEWMYRMNVTIAFGALVWLLFLYIRKEKRYHQKLMKCKTTEKEKNGK